jgi:hypothetical protein
MEAVDRAVVGGVGVVRLARARAGMDQVVVLEQAVVSEVATAAVAGGMTAAVGGVTGQRAPWARASASSPS